jgi:hypothetical protein
VPQGRQIFQVDFGKLFNFVHITKPLLYGSEMLSSRIKKINPTQPVGVRLPKLQ